MKWPFTFAEFLRSPSLWLTTGVGSGLSGFAPGTFGTLAALPAAYGLMHCGLTLQITLTLLTFALGTFASQQVVKKWRIDDPGFIVIDEWVGLFITVILATLIVKLFPQTKAPNGLFWTGAFAWFRLFDIWKPWPVSWADKHVKGGFGVMLDDTFAGMWAALALCVTLWLYGVLLPSTAFAP
jgi:phosphatidylglycerophosphatase A